MKHITEETARAIAWLHYSTCPQLQSYYWHGMVGVEVDKVRGEILLEIQNMANMDMTDTELAVAVRRLISLMEYLDPR